MRDRLRRLAEPIAVAGIVAALLWGVAITWQPMRVGGMSMYPALSAGDLVLVRRVRTRGDANPIDDRETTPLSAVAGHVTAVVPIGRLLERWRGEGAVRYDRNPIEQSKALTETARSRMSTDQGRAP